MNSWKPSQSDIDWVGNLIGILRHGGTWAIPQNGNVYVIDKEAKTLTLKEGINDFVHDRNKIVFEKFGYTVVG